ncbi:MAG: hypothetical protein ABSD96_14560 [Candidatus Korobacteraceae bacterium]
MVGLLTGGVGVLFTGAVGVVGVPAGVSVLGLALVAVVELGWPEPHPASIKQQAATTTTKQIPYFRAISGLSKSSYKRL